MGLNHFSNVNDTDEEHDFNIMIIINMTKIVNVDKSINDDDNYDYRTKICYNDDHYDKHNIIK